MGEQCGNCKNRHLTTQFPFQRKQGYHTYFLFLILAHSFVSCPTSFFFPGSSRSMVRTRWKKYAESFSISAICKIFHLFDVGLAVLIYPGGSYVTLTIWFDANRILAVLTHRSENEANQDAMDSNLANAQRLNNEMTLYNMCECQTSV